MSARNDTTPTALLPPAPLPVPRASFRPAPPAPVWDLDTIVPPAGEP